MITPRFRQTNRVRILFWYLLLLPLVCKADTNTDERTNIISAQSVGKLLGSAKTEEIFNGILNDPDILNTVVYGLTRTLFQTDQTNAVYGLIKDFNIRPKVFHTKDSTDSAVLGFEYDFRKSVANRVLLEKTLHPIGISFTLDAKGNVATEASKNPNNLLESGGSLHLFQGLGGINPTFKKDKNYLNALDLAQTAAGEIPDSPNWQDDVRWKNSAQMVITNIVPQFFWDLAAHGTLESDQQFRRKQYTYGGKIGFVFRDWTDRSMFTRFNVLDYPFAAIRWITATDKNFQLSGRAFPVVVAGIDGVDPASNNDRLLIDPDKSIYSRTRLEVHFKTHVLRWQRKNLAISLNYSWYQELGASQLIQNANQDRQQLFSAKLDLPYNFNISYSNGKLPLDQKRAETYALGYSLNF